jgi:hypothetical protein
MRRNLCLYDMLIVKALETVRVHVEETIIFVIARTIRLKSS